MDGFEMNDETPIDGVIAAGEWLDLSNEFSTVRVRKVRTRNGDRLDVFVPKEGRRILLDPMQLEILTAQDPEWFSMLFRKQLGSQ